jgi:imidazolonepropionase-like amidohydrolase
MSHHDALAAITLNPARIFGLDDRFGSIEVGKEADLVIWSGDPLETTTVAENVFIKGVQQSMSSRSRELRDRYIGTIRAGLQAGARPSTDKR